MRIVDSHCHLDFDVFKEDFPLVLQRAEEADVTVMQTICTKISQFEEIKKIAEKYDNIYCSVGIHPNEVEKEEHATAERLVQYANHPKVIGLGETGLDYYYENSARDLQIKAFKEHIKASRITGIPLIVHTRSADQDTVAIISEEMKIGGFTGLIHCFTSSRELAHSMLELGFYISISGIVTFKNATELQQIIKALPLEKLLVETDSPYLAPVPKRGKRNEPAYTKFVVEFLADMFNKTPAYIAQVTTENFYNLFTKARP
jgi:TatD DNase family protein